MNAPNVIGAARPSAKSHTTKPRNTTQLMYDVHSWTGVLAGWLLFAICLTGTLVVYKFPLKVMANPALVQGSMVDRIGPDGALARFQAARPNDRVTVVAFPSDIYSIHQYSIVARDADDREHRYWMDPASGRISDGLQSDFADFVQRLHAGLFMGKTGRWIVGALGIVMTLSLVTGLVFHWRRLRRDLFSLRLGGHLRKASSDLHKVAGVWAFVFHLVIALTGAWLGLETLIGVTASSASPIAIMGEGPGAPLPIGEIVARAKAARPDFKPTHVNLTNLGVAGSTIRMQGDLPGSRFVQRGQTMLVFDADSGQLLHTVDRTDQGFGRRLLAMVRPLHYGYFWPGIGEALYFILGAGTTLLVASGLLIWAERNQRARNPRARTHAATPMERANAGVMGGLMLALTAMAIIAGAARLPALASITAALGGLDFLGGQDLLGKKPIAAELWLFLALWFALGLLLAFIRPTTAWRAALLATAGGLILLPLLAAASVSPIAGFPRRGGGEGVGYTMGCALLAAGLALIARRIGRAPAPHKAA